MAKNTKDMTDQELVALMSALCVTLRDKCKELDVEEPGFALVVFPDPKFPQVAGNCNERTLIKALREAQKLLTERL
jgi:hypothetical protein